MTRRFRIAIMGTRGIPPRYGGFETFAYELSSRLAARGHQVTVYGRKGRAGKETLPNGVTACNLPVIPTKHLETVSHGFASAAHALGKEYDLALVCNQANAFILPLLRMAKIPTAICVDGIESRRNKWGPAARLWLKLCKPIVSSQADRLIADAKVIAEHWQPISSRPVSTIPYGVNLAKNNGKDALRRFGLEREGYFLYVSRLEPENNALMVIKAFEKVRTGRKLLIVGDAPYSKRYIRNLHKTKDRRILFPGAIYGEEYHQLMSNCFAYIQATEVGGTHPALLEGLAWSPCVIAHATPENLEVIGESALSFGYRDTEKLRESMQKLTDNPDLRDGFADAAATRLNKLYNWEEIVEKYEELFNDLCR